MKVRTKPKLAEAVQFQGSLFKVIDELGLVGDHRIDPLENGNLIVQTTMGIKEAKKNSWIVRDGAYLYVVSEDEFKSLFESV